MATKNGVPFRQMLVPESKYHIKCPYWMKPKKVTVHNTDNQMDAASEISYMRNNNNYTSYHVAIDEKEAIQGLPYNRNGWHSGDGNNGYGNRNTIGYEICRNYDRSRGTTNLNSPLREYYSKAEQNAIKVIAQDMVDFGIVASADTIKRHYDWSGKWCPSKILNEGRWVAVQTAIIAEYWRLRGVKTEPKETPKVVTKPKPVVQNVKKNATKTKTDKFRFNTTVKIRSRADLSRASDTGIRYYPNEMVYLDRVIEGTSYTWGSYLSHSGARRFVALKDKINKVDYGKFI